MSFEEQKNEGGVKEVDSKNEWIYGEPVSDRNSRQIQLAVEMYLEENPWDKRFLSNDQIEGILMKWAGSENSNSKVFGELCKKPTFKNHPRIAGDYANITVADFEYFKETGELPEN